MLSFEYIVVAAPVDMGTTQSSLAFWLSYMMMTLPVIWIVFQQPIKTAPRTNLSRVARLVKPCAVRNKDSRYEIEVKGF